MNLYSMNHCKQHGVNNCYECSCRNNALFQMSNDKKSKEVPLTDERRMREWVVEKKDLYYGNDQYSMNIAEEHTDKAVHVIEKSAFDALKAEVTKWKGNFTVKQGIVEELMKELAEKNTFIADLERGSETQSKQYHQMKEKLENELKEKNEEFERLYTSNEKQCSIHYFELVDMLKVPPLGSVIEAVERLQESASRWDALMSSERIRMIGCAQLDKEHQHLGLELWEKYPDIHIDSRDYLIKYVDAIRADCPISYPKSEVSK